MSKIRKEKIQIETAKTLIRNGGDCSKVNCKNCYYYHYLHQCIEFGHAADRYENHPELVIKKQKEFLAQTEYKDTYKINSCNCFEKIRVKLEKKVGYPLYDLEHIYCIPIYDDKKKEKSLIKPCDMDLPPLTYCPYCGKKIEVKEKII